VTRRRVWRVAGLAVLIAVLLPGCHKDHGTGSTSTALLYEFNAQQNNGRTVRWPDLPIRVFLGGNAARADEVNIWTSATNGAVTFAFIGSAGAANITFSLQNATDVCGVTFMDFDDNGNMTSAETRLSQPIYRGPQCERTVTHETAHAIGFLGHTSDGGLMDVDGGNGVITPLVAGVLQDLYHLPPGTSVSPEAKRFGLQRRGGRNVLTFVYPVRK
jgi:hypothetical protein